MSLFAPGRTYDFRCVGQTLRGEPCKQGVETEGALCGVHSPDGEARRVTDAQREIFRLRDEALALRAELAQPRKQYEALQREEQALSRRIGELRAAANEEERKRAAMLRQDKNAEAELVALALDAAAKGDAPLCDARTKLLTELRLRRKEQKTEPQRRELPDPS